jgi:hypothetical protein
MNLIDMVVEQASMSRIELLESSYSGGLVTGANFTGKAKGLNSKGQVVVDIDGKDVVTTSKSSSYLRAGSSCLVRASKGVKQSTW